METVDVIRQLWRRRVLVAIVLVVAALAALLSAYRVSVAPPGIEKRSLQVGAASSQILIDSPKSTLVAGASLGTFDALATRAKIYGEYLSSLAARQEIADIAGVPARSISSAGPFSPSTGQYNYESQSSEDRANEILEEGAANRLVFSAQDGVPILTVDAQAQTAAGAVTLADASFVTLKRYVHRLESDGVDIKRGVAVRELGEPEGGVIGGGNDMVLMVIAFLVVAALGCAAILLIPGFTRRWRALEATEHQPTPTSHYPASKLATKPRPTPSSGYDVAPVANGGKDEPVGTHAAHLP